MSRTASCHCTAKCQIRSCYQNENRSQASRCSVALQLTVHGNNRVQCNLTNPLGSASGGIRPKWSLRTVTMILPLAALALPALTARSVVKASSGLSLSLMRSKLLLFAGSCTPCFAIRMAVVSAVLMRGLTANFAGNEFRQVGQVFLPCATHFLKHAKQKLCWHGACA